MSHLVLSLKNVPFSSFPTWHTWGTYTQKAYYSRDYKSLAAKNAKDTLFQKDLSLDISTKIYTTLLQCSKTFAVFAIKEEKNEIKWIVLVLKPDELLLKPLKNPWLYAELNASQ